MKTLKIFNNQIESLLEDLINVTKNLDINGKIRVHYEKYKILKESNNEKVFLYFVKYILPLKDKVNNKNENFFLNLTIENNDDIFNPIKDAWKLLTNENKEIIWQYFHVLLKLSIKIIADKTAE